jgi:hypothetical protein
MPMMIAGAAEPGTSAGFFNMTPMMMDWDQWSEDKYARINRRSVFRTVSVRGDALVFAKEKRDTGAGRGCFCIQTLRHATRWRPPPGSKDLACQVQLPPTNTSLEFLPQGVVRHMTILSASTSNPQLAQVCLTMSQISLPGLASCRGSEPDGFRSVVGGDQEMEALERAGHCSNWIRH